MLSVRRMSDKTICIRLGYVPYRHVCYLYMLIMAINDMYFESHFTTKLARSCHSVTQSLSHSVTQSLSHSVTQSLSHSVTQSLSHSVTQSPSHPVTQSPSHPVTQSPSHPVTQSLRHSITQSLSHWRLSFYNNYSCSL